MFTFALARRLKGSDVTANALHPIAINTNFLNQASGILGKPVDNGQNKRLLGQLAQKYPMLMANISARKESSHQP